MYVRFVHITYYIHTYTNITILHTGTLKLRQHCKLYKYVICDCMIYGLFESTFCLTLDSQGAMYAVADMDNGYIVVDNTTAAAH